MNPELAHTGDRIDAHSGRVARIILVLHPAPSLALLRGALIHDDGESAVGDVKAPTKDADAAFAAMLQAAEERELDRLWPGREALNSEEADWLHFADRLDAFMWAAHHAPHVLGRDGWHEAGARLAKVAERLGCNDAFQRLALEACWPGYCLRSNLAEDATE